MPYRTPAKREIVEELPTKYRVSVFYSKYDGENDIPEGRSLWIRAEDRLDALNQALEKEEIEIRDLIHYDVIGVSSFHEDDEEEFEEEEDD